MAANVYDLGYDLEKALRESDDFKTLKRLYDEVNADDSARTLFESFRDIQLNLQQKQMSGQEISPEEIEQAQKSVALVQQHDKISKLMEAEQRMSMTIAELNKIIMKPLEELYGSLQQ
ncbi:MULTISPECIES: YlbF family regulator [Metabacillus]|uniref:YlbF family regulator n=1 Tax=Metabacillus hrfriensis TaxID=3048891 RepID=A0ACD4RDU6_9BACI|nr:MULTISPECIES: YlbF family regulator [Metabacillus]UAL53127.1 YlbF family regulator [Metabacillus dongyingensis]UOK58685.1 YlbF family regulator [Bacillus sp. OVS6]USK29453.1 YlbF family regulator [Bacillus sp. CMF21]WHZ58678.1 YlbF family regulator [Metabacillus sp. CT-WN-B3]